MYIIPNKSHRYCKRNHKFRKTHKHKTTQRYKKQIKGGSKAITNDKELKQIWNNGPNVFWEVNDGVSDTKYIYTQKLTYEKFKKKINNYLKQVEKGQKGAYIKKI